MLQNATRRRKSAPGPPNSFDEDISCTAPATEKASLQILCKCPTPAMVFGNSPKPSRFAHFWQGAQSLAPATRHLNVQKWSEPLVFLTFWLRNVLRATTACTFSTSQLPKVVRTWCALYFLTSKCASCHNGVHFFDISTSKSGPSMLCFVHFDFEMCFAPQRRALFRHLNFEKCSKHGVLCTFWLQNVLRATTACTFSTSQLRKVVRTWGAFSFFTCKCASRHNGVQFFISHLASWPRTRRFSEPTFRPSGATNHWKNTVFCDFPTFSRIWASFFWLFLFSDLLSSTLLFSLTLPVSAFHLSILSEVELLNFLRLYTSSTAQGGGGSFKNRKPIGEVGCCESRMAEPSHWWTDRWLRSLLFLSLAVSFSDYLPTYPLSIYVSIYLSLCLSIYLSIDRSIDLSIYRSIDLSIYRSICLSFYRSIYLSMSLSLSLASVYLTIYLTTYRSTYLSNLSINLSIYPSILSIYLSN